MNQDRWDDIKRSIESKFSVLEAYEEDMDPGWADVVIFESPLGKLRIRFVTRPKMLDKKTTYSKRGGSDVSVEYTYSEDETVSHLTVEKWDADRDEWGEIDASSVF